MPTDVFKFVSVRPPQMPPSQRWRHGFARFPAGGRSPFHQRVRELQGDDRRDLAMQLATDHLVSDEYSATIAGARDGLGGLLNAVDLAAQAPTVAEAGDVFADTVGTSVADFLAGPGPQLADHLWDGWYANCLAPERRPEDREWLRAGIAALHFVASLRDDPPAAPPLPRVDLAEVRVTLPPDLIPAPAAVAPAPGITPEQARARLREVANRVDGIVAAIDDVRNADRMFLQRLSIGTVAGDGRLPAPAGGAGRGPVAPARRLNAHEFAATLQSLPVVNPAVLQLLPGLGSFATRDPDRPWVFSDFARTHLAARTQAVLEERRTDIDGLSAAGVADVLRAELAGEVIGYVRSLDAAELALVAGTPELTRMTGLVPVRPTGFPPLKVPPVPPPFPGAAFRGIRPLGIGDLLVVREEWRRYAPGEVAHIENVLQGESKSRKHRRLRRTEEVLVTETEAIEESEKDLQTTERFELHRETERTIQSDLSFAAGTTVSGSYGTVSFGAHADFATTTSRTESNRNATNYAKDVTERSLARILRRAREERTRRTLEEFEETNQHGINNTGGPGHIVGVYRWVDKYLRARVHNYGRRLMFEFVVPEPAAFFLHSQAGMAHEGVGPPPAPPEVFDGTTNRPLRPDDVTGDNYLDWVGLYQVEDVTPFPPAQIAVAHAFGESSGGRENVPIGKAYAEITIPPGYRAVTWGGSWGSVETDDPWGLGIDVAVVADGVEGDVPVYVLGSVAAFALGVKVYCDRTEAKLAEWQLATYASIMTAYQRQLADFNERVAAASIQQGISIAGRNPGLNRRIERDELEKAALRLLTDEYAHTRVRGVWRHGDQFDAMQPLGAHGYPEFDVAEATAEGQVVRFFEQAFEWNNLTYLFYPYFWGRKSRWLDVFPLDDPDPQFRDFLRAGSARVVVPVHPAFNEAVLHYINTNEIWNGGQPPTLNDPLFVSIVDELRDASSLDVEAEIVGEWEVKLPTSLVYLQADAALPDLDAA